MELDLSLPIILSELTEVDQLQSNLEEKAKHLEERIRESMSTSDEGDIFAYKRLRLFYNTEKKLKSYGVRYQIWNMKRDEGKLLIIVLYAYFAFVNMDSSLF